MSEIETESVSLNLGDIKIDFLNRKGEPLKPGETAYCYQFRISGGGIDPRRVVAVELPRLDYDNLKELLVKVILRTALPKIGK